MKELEKEIELLEKKVELLKIIKELQEIIAKNTEYNPVPYRPFCPCPSPIIVDPWPPYPPHYPTVTWTGNSDDLTVRMTS